MLIGIAGPKRSGKNTLADRLSELFGLAHLSYAGPLRKFVAEILGWTVDELEKHKEAPIKWLDGATPRQMMQTVGTEWGREMVHDELWVRSLFARMPESGAVVSDVRFPNEAREILKRGGIVIQLSRKGTGEGDAHKSERPLPSELVSFCVCNDGTPDDLLAAALTGIRSHNAADAFARDDEATGL